MADRLRCCQLRWTVSVVNWWRSQSPVYQTFTTQTVVMCVKHGGHESLHHAGLSVAAETCILCWPRYWGPGEPRSVELGSKRKSSVGDYHCLGVNAWVPSRTLRCWLSDRKAIWLVSSLLKLFHRFSSGMVGGRKPRENWLTQVWVENNHLSVEDGMYTCVCVSVWAIVAVNMKLLILCNVLNCRL